MDDDEAPTSPTAEEHNGDDAPDTGGSATARPTLQLDKKTEQGFCSFFRAMPEVSPVPEPAHTPQRARSLTTPPSLVALRGRGCDIETEQHAAPL